MASKHKEGLNVKEKVSGGKRAMSEEMRMTHDHEERISELENKFKNHTHGSNGKEIAELRNQIQNNSVADLNHYNELKEGLSSHTNMIGVQMDKYIELKEVLRELLAEIFIFTYPEDPEECNKIQVAKYRELLAKLDGTEEEKG